MIKKKLTKLAKFFDLDSLVKHHFSLEKTAEYYRINKWAYSLFHDKEYIHMGISEEDGVFRKRDLQKPAKIVLDVIEKHGAESVLELACGRGGNSQYIASRRPQAKFQGIDYSSTQLSFTSFIDLSNLYFVQGDFHQLPCDDCSFDVVFVVEAICYSTQKNKVLDEAYRVLKPGGRFIIIDGYAVQESSSMSQDELMAFTLTAKGMALDEFESYEQLKGYARGAGFIVDTERDVSERILPTTDRFERLSSLFLSWGLIAKTLLKLLPFQFKINIVSGYLISELVRQNIACYWVTVLQKP